MEEEDFELPDLPRIDKGPPPDCPICGDPMSFIDGDWACVDCNGELLGPETGLSLVASIHLLSPLSLPSSIRHRLAIHSPRLRFLSHQAR